MFWQQSFLRFATLALALSVESVTIAQVQSQVTRAANPWLVDETAAYEPSSDIGAPDRTESGATRNPKTCSNREQPQNPPLTALMPKNADLGLTVEERPIFFVYVPQTSAQTMKFVLQDEDGAEIYGTTWTISKMPGIVSFKLPDTAPSLKVGKTYQWTVAIVCPPKINGFREEPGVYGKIRLIELPVSVYDRLEGATPGDRIELYRQYKIWHDALATLAELRRDNPNDLQLAAGWKELLESAGLGELAQIPL